MQAVFSQAVEKANNFSKKPSDAELLRMYGLYKQATVGDVNTGTNPYSHGQTPNPTL